MFDNSLRIIDEPKMSEIRILYLCHKKSILVDIYRQLLVNIILSQTACGAVYNKLLVVFIN